MKTEAPFHEGTLDWYRERGKTHPDIAALVAMVDRQGLQLVKALEALAQQHIIRMAAAKILTSHAA